MSSCNPARRPGYDPVRLPERPAAVQAVAAIVATVYVTSLITDLLEGPGENVGSVAVDRRGEPVAPPAGLPPFQASSGARCSTMAWTGVRDVSIVWSAVR